MKYKKGDRVRLISKPTKYTTAGVEKYLGKVVTISGIGTSIFSTVYYTIEEDDDYTHYFEDTIAGLASETPFDFDAWKGKDVCMHCKTEEEAEDFCREMAKAGLRWSNGESYLELSNFRNHENHICYFFNNGAYSGYEYAKTKGCTILEWSDYRSTEPPKAEEPPKEEQEKTMEAKIDDKPLSYQEAIKISRRICKSYEGWCEGCPFDYLLDSNDKTCWDALRDDSNEVEKVMKKWAVEHPVKTNRDKLIEVFGEIQKYDDECEHHCVTVPCKSCNWWHQEYVEPDKEKE